MKHFYLIRHGQKQGLLGDPELTELGHQQADLTGRYLQTLPQPITQLLASPRLRTQQTAAAIAKHTQLPISTHPWLKEQGLLPMLNPNRHQLELLIEELLPNSHQHIALVTHNTTIRDFVHQVIDDHTLAQHAQHLPHGLDYRVDECSVTVVSTNGAQFELKQLVSIDHLGNS